MHRTTKDPCALGVYLDPERPKGFLRMVACVQISAAFGPLFDSAIALGWHIPTPRDAGKSKARWCKHRALPIRGNASTECERETLILALSTDRLASS